ncbi:MAG: GNAT family N-acetyltransferase [Flavicella sp.]
MQASHKLDTPIKHASLEVHKAFCQTYRGAEFYKPQYCGFGSIHPDCDGTEAIEKYTDLTPSFYILGPKPICSNTVNIKKAHICNQMWLLAPMKYNIDEPIIPLVTKKQIKDLQELVTLVMPGFIKSKTSDLGRYFGIYKDNLLVAVCGERIKMDEYTEISSVVTHPNYTRRGYSKQLMKHTTDLVFKEGKIPFLHVDEINTKANNLYSKLGFTTRKKLEFWLVTED